MRFDGFTTEGLELLARLPQLDKEQFQAEKTRYTELIAEPAKAFVADLGPTLQERISPTIQYAPKTNGSIAPINNDLRFNPGAAPYKDHLLVKFWDGPSKKTAPTLYVRISPSDVGFATGAAFDPARLDDIRAIFDADGAPLAEAIRLRLEAGGETGEPDLKRVPPPYAADHPHGDLLRRKGLQVRWLTPLPRAVGSNTFVESCAKELEKATPIHRWLVSHLT